jgi:hypothetical protein
MYSLCDCMYVFVYSGLKSQEKVSLSVGQTADATHIEYSRFRPSVKDSFIDDYALQICLFCHLQLELHS